ncbi:two-component system nitrate/nitrite response regulator NarL [Geodermatophilus bullaregiensis]|uniref:response regulator transcription factor n=1 Tax=Geodermatophilus bullaregiensis TaxID=1564160 RepID=UPI0019563C55|nr:response regulator transcription factor [Geodermatophilus bullaregiensis]MBM7808957.1 two-component system nitrate/nitrite response regulator NarL [Geodermatophilus bullaregiensis]
MRLVICDDHRLFVEPLAAALARNGHDVVVATTPLRALEAVAEHQPDLVVLDLRYPDGDGIETLVELRDRRPACPVVILSGSVDSTDLTAAAAAGAAAFLRKDQPVAAIIDALDRVASGRAVSTPPMARRRGATDAHERVRWLVDHLTDREREVLQALIRAEDTVEIARSLGVEASTARTHVQNVLFKLGVHTRLQAVALAVSSGLDADLPTPSTAKGVGDRATSAGRPPRLVAGASGRARDPRGPR